jgi:4'-phosphopantetheinyl transferase
MKTQRAVLDEAVAATGARPADVWFRFTDDLTELDIAAAMAVLSPGERARCDRFVFSPDKHTYAAAHGLLRSALTLRQGARLPGSWRFDAGAHGKPYLAPGQPPVGFNLTHTRGLVACALADVETIGIDVECVERRADTAAVASRYFSEREILALDHCAARERQVRFIELWTLKEAYLKATGAGLSTPLNQFGFELRGDSGLEFHAPDATSIGDWRFALFAPSPGYRLAVAVRSVRPVEFSVRAWGAAATVAAVVPLRVSHGR